MESLPPASQCINSRSLIHLQKHRYAENKCRLSEKKEYKLFADILHQLGLIQFETITSKQLLHCTFW